ncbi:hypothetical protein ROZALSC1DRAFT_24283 [Rozella allomycis CSF55]|uniref:Uncharacterized protein n=1 Tax=Rozella allomycis (strain CSF55) TaxID=988480 RepID=A0A4V1IZA3_ROZAC|nr:hypothetical protein ROZALSC1DRAFT_24283 [Rozella allomycis CSF55]
MGHFRRASSFVRPTRNFFKNFKPTSRNFVCLGEQIPNSIVFKSMQKTGILPTRVGSSALTEAKDIVPTPYQQDKFNTKVDMPIFSILSSILRGVFMITQEWKPHFRNKVLQ